LAIPAARDDSRDPGFRIPLMRLGCCVVLGAWTRHDRCPAMPLEHDTALLIAILGLETRHDQPERLCGRPGAGTDQELTYED
jgi:hypothetical protein